MDEIGSGKNIKKEERDTILSKKVMIPVEEIQVEKILRFLNGERGILECEMVRTRFFFYLGIFI